jgi:predicted small lipoprotein YifL
MKAWLVTVFVLAMAGGMSGCGQKGPLYQDAPTQTSAEDGAEENAEDRSR